MINFIKIEEIICGLWSSTKAKYRSMANAARERDFVVIFGHTIKNPISETYICIVIIKQLYTYV